MERQSDEDGRRILAAGDRCARLAGGDNVAELQRQRDEYYDRLLRKTAEFDNYRKRIERERQAPGGVRGGRCARGAAAAGRRSRACAEGGVGRRDGHVPPRCRADTQAARGHTAAPRSASNRGARRSTSIRTSIKPSHTSRPRIGATARSSKSSAAATCSAIDCFARRW